MLTVLGVVVASLLSALAGAWWWLTRRVRGRFFDAGGVRLHYTDEGAGHGDPVVLLHGFAVNADLNWRRPGLTAAFARERRVLALDQRGHGLSDKPGPGRYGVEMARDVVRLLDHVGVARAHLVGYSLGGFVALKVAADHADRLLSVSVHGAGWEAPGQSALLGALPEVAGELEAGRGVGPLAGHLGAERPQPGLVHRLWVRIVTRWLNDPRALASVVRGVPSLAVDEATVRGLGVRSCTVVGGRDPLLVSAEALHERAPDHRLVVVDGADHIATPARAEARDAMLAFLRR